MTDLYEVSERLGVLSKALQELRDTKGLDFAALMVTDVVRGSSRLYPPLQDGTRLAEGVVSRKKQLLPGILGLLEA